LPYNESRVNRLIAPNERRNENGIKDTSRFGRNWVKSGDYFERIDEMGIRFISIQEGIDTIDPKCPALKMLPFYFIFNEWHSATTSEKIRAVFNKQAEQGKYRSHRAPYGYEKDPDDKYRLVVDPVTAPVVKRIFEMRSEYALKYEAEKQELTNRAKQLAASIERQSQTENDVETFVALMKKYVNITELDRAATTLLIDHITVSARAVKPREIVIYYNFIGNVEQHGLRL
jgi:DNA invertase Pin-like site-specific DNA recombinase